MIDYAYRHGFLTLFVLRAYIGAAFYIEYTYTYYGVPTGYISDKREVRPHSDMRPLFCLGNCSRLYDVVRLFDTPC